MTLLNCHKTDFFLRNLAYLFLLCWNVI